MGEVYRATDTKLGRDVALKLLPVELALDPDRLARFEREAKVLASLNHPNVAHLYGFEQVMRPDASRAYFLTMELVEGEDLAERLKRGPVAAEDAIAIAKQVAEALEEAHEKGIVHRDLKPANVKLTPDGKVKVLDFGLAKAWSSDASGVTSGADLSQSPTLAHTGTAAGLILGTAAYMSPEQARGKPVDKRADIWAFGVVLFELLSGRRLFEGETVSDVLASVLKSEPDWKALPAATPASLRRLLERCLERDPKQRLRDVGDARVELARIEAGAPERGPGRSETVAPPVAPTRRVAPLLVATAALAILATFGLTRWLMPRAAATGGSLAHVGLVLPEGDELGGLGGQPVAVAADGAHVAYVGLRDGTTRIYLHTLSEAAPKALDGTEGGEGPFFSPDGQWIGFFAGSRLRKIAVGGAGLATLAEAPYQRGGDWGSDGYVYFAPTNLGGIWRVPESGGTATEVTRKDPASGEISHRWPHLVEGANVLLFGAWTGPGDDEHHVAFQALGATGHRVLVKGGDAPRYAAAPGVLLYAHVGGLFAVPWRPSQPDLGRAVPAPLLEHTEQGGFNEGQGNYALAAGGTLAYIAGGRARNAARLVFVDRAGRVEPAPLPERNYENVVLSPDGKRAIVQIREGIIALWMYDLSRQTLTPLGATSGSSQAPAWTADGARVIYRGTRKGLRNLYWRPADGSGDEEAITTKADVIQTPTSVSPDGHWLLFNETSAQEAGGVGIWVMRLDGDRTPRHLFPQPAGEQNGQFSPDGRWIAYQATVSSRPEIYVAPFPGPGPRQQVSTDGGIEPLWSRDGRELFFQSGARLMSVEVALRGAFSASTPRLVHEGRFLKSGNATTGWGIAADGRRFLRMQQVEPERAITHVDLVLNWFEELKARVPSP